MKISQIIGDAIKFSLDHEGDEVSNLVEATVLPLWDQDGDEEDVEMDQEEFEIMAINYYDGKVPPVVDEWLEGLGDHVYNVSPEGIVDDL